MTRCPVRFKEYAGWAGLLRHCLRMHAEVMRDPVRRIRPEKVREAKDDVEAAVVRGLRNSKIGRMRTEVKMCENTYRNICPAAHQTNFGRWTWAVKSDALLQRWLGRRAWAKPVSRDCYQTKVICGPNSPVYLRLCERKVVSVNGVRTFGVCTASAVVLRVFDQDLFDLFNGLEVIVGMFAFLALALVCECRPHTPCVFAFRRTLWNG
jgi:hypothetical protein